MSTVESTTGNSLETKKAQEPQGTHPAMTPVESGRPMLSASVLNFTRVSMSPERLNLVLVVGFSFVRSVCVLSANLTITPDPISVSEGQNFSIKCISDVSNYDEVYWNTSAGIKIYQKFYTARRSAAGAESVLTVETATREWNGGCETPDPFCCHAARGPWEHPESGTRPGGAVLRCACTPALHARALQGKMSQISIV